MEIIMSDAIYVVSIAVALSGVAVQLGQAATAAFLILIGEYKRDKKALLNALENFKKELNQDYIILIHVLNN